MKKQMDDLLNEFLNIFKRIRSWNEFATDKEIRPFNIILETTDLYYRENFHSDIIASILRRHHFLDIFIDWLNVNSAGLELEKSHYKKTEILREDSKIDILIRDLVSRHCIIFENKINDAVDMDRQLPRYVEAQKNQGFEIDAVIYFSLRGTKEPNQSTWTNDDKVLVKYIRKAASVNNHEDFVNGVLNLCEVKSQNLEEFSFVKQYKDLIEYLGREKMDLESMSAFADLVADKEKFSTSLKITEMMSNLKEFRRITANNYFISNHEPFPKLWTYDNAGSLSLIFSTIDNDKDNISLEIIFDDTETTVRFWILNSEKISDDLVWEVIKGTTFEKDFEKINRNRYEKYFPYPEEDSKLFLFIESLLNQYKFYIGQKN